MIKTDEFIKSCYCEMEKSNVSIRQLYFKLVKLGYERTYATLCNTMKCEYRPDGETILALNAYFKIL